MTIKEDKLKIPIKKGDMVNFKKNVTKKGLFGKEKIVSYKNWFWDVEDVIVKITMRGEIAYVSINDINEIRSNKDFIDEESE